MCYAYEIQIIGIMIFHNRTVYETMNKVLTNLNFHYHKLFSLWKWSSDKIKLSSTEKLSFTKN